MGLFILIKTAYSAYSTHSDILAESIRTFGGDSEEVVDA